MNEFATRLATHSDLVRFYQASSRPGERAAAVWSISRVGFPRIFSAGRRSPRIEVLVMCMYICVYCVYP